MKSSAIDIASGSIGGIAGTIVGHPFDTLKVRLQTSANTKQSASVLFQEMLKNEGMRGMFRGILPPVYSMAAVTAYLFAVEGAISRQLELKKYGTAGTFISGALAGAAQSIILTPVELVKTQLQVQRTNTHVSEMSFAKELYKNFGLRGFYRGFFATMFRDAPACGCYFMGYSLFLGLLDSSQQDSTTLQLSKHMLSGGLAGVISWAISFPQDVIKSRIQGDNLRNRKYKNMIDCYRQTTKNGKKILFRGLNPALLRAFPSNGALFTAHHMCLNFLHGLN